ncbi:MAG: DUF4242 domain-containing protein [Thermoleophilia bacterium]
MDDAPGARGRGGPLAAGRQRGDVERHPLDPLVRRPQADGSLGTVCIYQASSEEKIREHAARAGLPATAIFEVADTVIVRPDPVPVPA